MPKPVCIENTPEQIQQIGPEKRHLNPWLGKVGVCLGSIALGAGIGTYVGIEQTTQSELAGSNTTLELELGSDVIDVDSGIVGLRIPSDYSIAGVPVGAKIQIEATKDGVQKGSKLNDAVIAEYLQLFSDPNHEIEQMSSDKTWHILRDTRNGAFGGLLFFGAGMLFYAEHKRARNKLSEKTKTELHAAYLPMRKWAKRGAGLAGAAMVITACVSGGAAVIGANGAPDTIEANPIFDDTTLEGSELVGIGAPLISDFVPKMEEYVAENDKFYNLVVDNFNNEFENYILNNQLPEGDSIIPIALVSDRHCNVGMDRVIAAVAKKFKTLIVASGGDDHFSGTFSFEDACVSGLADRLGALGTKFVATIGNHDPRDKEMSHDENVLIVDGNSEVVSTANDDVVFLSARDPRRSKFGEDTVPKDQDEQIAALNEQGLQLGELACASDKTIDILIAHDKRAAETAIRKGCGKIRFSLSGHQHKQEQPRLIGDNTFLFVQGTTGGASREAPSYGPLKHPADITVLFYDSFNHKPVGIVNITVQPDGRVSIGEFEPLAYSTNRVRYSNKL